MFLLSLTTTMKMLLFHYGKDLASIKDISDARRKVEIRLVILIFLSTALPNFDGLIN